MEIKEVVKEKYGEAARRVTSGGSNGCCGSAPSSLGCVDPITSNLYAADETGQLPETAVLASLGCGNPTALAQLNAGETVRDLGSGGGIDVLLSAKRVGPMGKAYGLDMTDKMLALPNENKRKAEVENVKVCRVSRSGSSWEPDSMKHCNVEISGRDGTTHIATIEASSLFDAKDGEL